MTVPPEWFRDAVHDLISSGEVGFDEGLLLIVAPPDWAFGPEPKDYKRPEFHDARIDGYVCSGCFTVQPEECFYFRPNGRRYNKCRTCSAAAGRERRKKDGAFSRSEWLSLSTKEKISVVKSRGKSYSKAAA